MTARSKTLTTILLIASIGAASWSTLGQSPTELPKASLLNTAYIDALPKDIPEIIVFVPPPMNRFAALVERPPFRQSRRPREASPPEQLVEAQESTPAFTAKLLGTRIDPESRAALFRTTENDEEKWMGEGEIVDGWTIHAINSGGSIRALR